MSDFLRGKLAGVKTKKAAVAGGTGLSYALVLVPAWIILMMIMDWYIELPLAIRAVMLVAGALAALGLIVWLSILPIVNGPDVEEVALAVEHEHADFRTRLIAAIQFSTPGAIPPGASASLARITIQEAETMAAPLNFNGVVKTKRLLIAMAIAFGVVILSTGSLVLGGPRVATLLKRAFLSNVDLPTRTRVIDKTPLRKVPQGEDFAIIAEAEGVVPDKGQVDITWSDGNVIHPYMEKQRDEKTFRVVIPSVSQPFKYKIWLNDAHGTVNYVEVAYRPAIKDIGVIAVFPEYTHVPPSPRRPSDISVVAGSKLRLTVESTKPVVTDADPAVRGNYVYVHNGMKETWWPLREYRMTVDPRNPMHLSRDIGIPDGTDSFYFTLLDEDGFANKEGQVFPVDVFQDRPPSVHIVKPDRKEILRVVNSKLDVGFIAEDDFWVTAASLKYRVIIPSKDNLPVGPADPVVNALPLEIEPGPTIDAVYTWDLSKVKIPADDAGRTYVASLEGCVVEFWLEVSDGNPNAKNGPVHVSSDKYMVRIVTKAEKQAELMSMLVESLESIRGVSDNQEKANTELGNIITGGSQTQPATEPGQ